MTRVSLLLLALAACRPQATHEPRPHAPGDGNVGTVGTRLTPDVALATIETSYLGGMQRCYRARLKRDERAGGRVVVTFTVDETGRLAFRQARGIGRTLEDCVERAMSRWSFPPPAVETTFRLAFRLSSRA